MVSGTINYKVPDLNTLAIYIGDEEVTEAIPNGDYVINTEDSYCTIGSSTEQHKDIPMEYKEGKIYIGINQKNTKCYVYLMTKPITTGEEMLAKLEGIRGTKFTVEKMPTITGADTSTSTNKLYTTPDDHGTSYVFRGNVTDNWLRFANKTWRIIRINGDGTLRIIYQCGSNTCTDKTGDVTQVGTSMYNSSVNDNTYVGFYTGTLNSSKQSESYDNAHNNSNPSTIAGYLNEWYTSSGLSSYASKISGETGWCNDRELSSGTGYGYNDTTYAAYYRLETNKSPILTCTNQSRDLFTTNTTSLTTENKGNKKLTAPIGLLTADEVMFAGGYSSIDNTSYYLYTGNIYWAMSPRELFSDDFTIASVFAVDSNGWLNLGYVGDEYGVRPVINLKSDVTITGKGTENEPFVVS